MRIVLYTCTAENNRVDKESFISNSFQLEGTLRNESSVIDPVITVEKTNPARYNYNYMFIEEFKRYYFINNIVHLRENLWEIHAHVDVLYTWLGDIKNSKCIVDKTQNPDDSNMYFDDGSFVMDSRKYNVVRSFSSGFNDGGQYILICAGGY